MTNLRERIIDEAISWIGTPYRPGGRVKQGGCDCGTFILQVLVAVGIISPDDAALIEYSPAYASAHWKTERYLLLLMRHGKKIIESVGYPTFKAQPGDIVLARAGGIDKYNHGAVVIAWPKVVHAVNPYVHATNALTHPLFAYMDLAWFDVTKQEQMEKVHVR